jgi:hypothetical protein
MNMTRKTVIRGEGRVIVFNATFNNISISFISLLLEENRRPAAKSLTNFIT